MARPAALFQHAFSQCVPAELTRLLLLQETRRGSLGFLRRVFVCRCVSRVSRERVHALRQHLSFL